MTRSRLLLVGAFLVMALVCVRLAVWQLDRLKERRAVNAVALAARSAPIVLLTGSQRDSTGPNRRVRASGRYDHAHDIVLRGRVYRGVPGVEIVSPLVLADSGVAVLVNRGFVPAPDAVSFDPAMLQTAGPAFVEGIALPMGSGAGAPLRRGSLTTWARLDSRALESQLPYRVYSFYIQQTPDSASSSSYPRRLDPPALNDGPHLNYAIQWFAFAGMAVVFAGIMARLKPGTRPAPR